MMKRNRLKGRMGFTLAELLIALAILGVIATFTIPKVLSSSTSEAHYTKAMSALGTLAELNRAYLMENDNCYPGHITCNINSATGAALDGKPTVSRHNSNPDAYNKLLTFLDSHLNYIRKFTWVGNYVCYEMADGMVICPYGIQVYAVEGGKYDLAWAPHLYINRTRAQLLADQYASGGVDSHNTYMFLYRNGTTVGGENNWGARNGFAYDPDYASVFDIKEHPEDTCEAVGGFNCGSI